MSHWEENICKQRVHPYLYLLTVSLSIPLNLLPLAKVVKVCTKSPTPHHKLHCPRWLRETVSKEDLWAYTSLSLHSSLHTVVPCLTTNCGNFNRNLGKLRPNSCIPLTKTIWMRASSKGLIFILCNQRKSQCQKRF